MRTPRTASQRRPKIMFIDDDPDLQELYSRLCRQWGFEVANELDSGRAVEGVVSAHPDLVFLDVCMPGMDGFAVLAKLKDDTRVRNIPVVMLTAGGTSVPERVEGLDRGAIDYLIKPITPEELLARIKSYLRQQHETHRRVAAVELETVRRTATFLNHSINNLLSTIQVAASLAEEEQDEESRERGRMIAENVQAITEIVQRLRSIKRVMVTTYVGDEEMLDLDSSVKGEAEG